MRFLKTLIVILITLSILLVSGYSYRKNLFSFRFVDEEYNFAIGKYLTRGEILYDHIITNHQPITHILSGLIQKYTKPNTAYLLINRHRTAIILWSAIWSLFLVTYFGLAASLFVLIYELTKSYMFGNLFLAETVVVYPLVFLLGLTLFKKLPIRKWELFFSGICLTFLTFTLGPIWPSLGLLVLLLIYRQRSNLRSSLIYLALGDLMVVLLIMKYTSFLGYAKIYLLTNLTYTIPSYHNSYYHESWILTITKAFITPALSFFTQDVTPILWIIRTLSLLLIIHLAYLFYQKKYYLAISTFLLLGLTNIRFVNPGSGHYAGFHLLPWYACLIFLTLLLSFEHFKSKIYPSIKMISLFLVVASIFASLNFAKSELFIKSDPKKDYEINFSTHITLGEIVRILKNPNDTLFVAPDAWLVYWQSDTKHLPKLFGYYPWMGGIPKFHEAVIQAFILNPPTFFYCENCKNSELEQFLNKYIEIRRYGGKTNLYVIPEKIKNLSVEEKAQLKFYGVDLD